MRQQANYASRCDIQQQEKELVKFQSKSSFFLWAHLLPSNLFCVHPFKQQQQQMGFLISFSYLGCLVTCLALIVAVFIPFLFYNSHFY